MFKSDRYPELLKSPDTCESLYSDRNSSYDNVEKRNMNREDTPDSRKDCTYDPSEWETMLDTDAETDIEKIKRNKSFKERLDPLLCKFYISLFYNKFFADIKLASHIQKIEKFIKSSICIPYSSTVPDKF